MSKQTDEIAALRKRIEELEAKAKPLPWRVWRSLLQRLCGRVESYLLRCCEANGLLADDGERQCRATLASGINAGMGRPYHDIKAEWD